MASKHNIQSINLEFLVRMLYYFTHISAFFSIKLEFLSQILIPELSKLWCWIFEFIEVAKG